MIKYEVIEEIQCSRDAREIEDSTDEQLKTRYSVPTNAKFTVVNAPPGGWTHAEPNLDGPFEIAQYYDGAGHFGGRFKKLLMIAYEVE